MIATPPALAALAKPWAGFYSDSKTAATVVVFLHIAPLIVGGGLAIATDRATLRAVAGAPQDRTAALSNLAGAHRTVIASLGVSAISGIALLASDLDTFLGSWVFWLKMGLVVLLLVNGGMLSRAEAVLRRTGGEEERSWRQLRLFAMLSLILWITTTFVGVALTNAA